MIDTVLFDLDGTLLQFNQEEFITAYLTKLKDVFSNLGLDSELAIKAVWAGTKSMVTNDGAKLNSERFWETFSSIMNVSDRLEIIKESCDRFYSNEFDTIKSILTGNEPSLPRRLVNMLKSKGYHIVLATNPLFPTCAVTTRLKWIGLTPQDFCLITDYSNSTYCKPAHEYYREIFKKINKEPSQCLMIGNNVREDMCVSVLGAETFLVTDYIENETGADISMFRNGTLIDLEAYLDSLAGVKDKK